jgi:imidazolonepropionase-like amidohydrolase
MEILGARNLGFLAGPATGYGISQEDALSLITRNPAKILGIDKRCGTIEVGKDASFFLSAGNALDMKTQNISQAWIQGRPVSMESKQTVLYEKFRNMLIDGRF